ncbi:MAG: serine/threonine-protein kinase [Pirellulales bacterium]
MCTNDADLLISDWSQQPPEDLHVDLVVRLQSAANAYEMARNALELAREIERPLDLAVLLEQSPPHCQDAVRNAFFDDLLDLESIEQLLVTEAGVNELFGAIPAGEWSCFLVRYLERSEGTIRRAAEPRGISQFFRLLQPYLRKNLACEAAFCQHFGLLERGTKLKVDEYEIKGIVGVGGMGVVYEARQKGGKSVAVKTPRPDLLQCFEHTREAFLKEAHVSNHLEGEGLVPVHYVDREFPFYVMRLVPGATTLQHRMEAGTLDVRTIGEILQSTARGLRKLHHFRHLHLDLKPSNILITDASHAFLTDFGLICRLSNKGTAKLSRFQGTSQYAAPEQIRGETLNFATDIYSLGEVGLQAIKGMKPGKDRELRHHLTAICNRAHSSDPTRRYQTATEFEADLVRCLSGGVPCVSVKHVALSWARRWRWGIAAAMMLVVIAFAWAPAARAWRVHRFFSDYSEITALQHHSQKIVGRGERTEPIPTDPKDPTKLAVLPVDQGFRIHEDSRFFDLTAWRPLQADELKRDTINPCYHTRAITVSKTDKQARWLRVRFWTSGYAVHAYCASHPYRIAVGYDAHLVGQQMTEVEELQIDTEGHEGEFQIIVHATFWNAFHTQDQYWAGMNVLHGTKKAQLAVLIGYPYLLENVSEVTGNEQDPHAGEPRGRENTSGPLLDVTGPQSMVHKLQWKSVKQSWIGF